jgi:hypothetical protein
VCVWGFHKKLSLILAKKLRNDKKKFKKISQAPMLVILATQEAEITRIAVQSQPGQIVCETLSQKTLHKKIKRAGGVTQGVSPEFKPQYHKKPKPKQTNKKTRLISIHMCSSKIPEENIRLVS